MQMLTQYNSDLGYDVVSDLLIEANKGFRGRRMVWCGYSTLNTPFKEGLTTLDNGLAVLAMSSLKYGTITYYTCGGTNPKIFIRTKTNDMWGAWDSVALNSDFAKIHIQQKRAVLQSGQTYVDVPFSEMTYNAIPVLVQRSKTVSGTDLFIISTHIPTAGTLRLFFNKSASQDLGIDFSIVYYK